jgi:hypothetical protein
MTELFTDEEEKELISEDIKEPALELVLPPVQIKQKPSENARRRLEDLLDEKKLRDELDDFGSF